MIVLNFLDKLGTNTLITIAVLFCVMLIAAIILRKHILGFINKNREICMYIIFGVATTLVSLVTYFLCAEFIFDVQIVWQLQAANVISWIISVMFAYVTNKKFVFQSKAAPLKEMAKFYLSRVGTLLIDMFLMYLFVTVLSMEDMLSKILVNVVVVILNYVFGKLLVFNRV